MDVFTALITPFTKEKEIDYAVLPNLIEYVLNQGSNGLVIGDIVGEVIALEPKERLELVGFILKNIKNTELMFNATLASTKQTIIFIKKLEELGVDTIVLDTPYYIKPTQQGLYIHFKTIAQNTGVSIVLKNAPDDNLINLEFQTIKRLIDSCPNIIGLIETTNQFDKIKRLKKYKPRFKIFIANDSLLSELSMIDISGVISVNSHFIGNKIVQLLEALDDGIFLEELNEQIKQINKLVELETTSATIKYLLSKKGLINNELRLPIIPLSLTAQIIIDNNLK